MGPPGSTNPRTAAPRPEPHGPARRSRAQTVTETPGHLTKRSPKRFFPHLERQISPRVRAVTLSRVSVAGAATRVAHAATWHDTRGCEWTPHNGSLRNRIHQVRMAICVSCHSSSETAHKLQRAGEGDSF